jgi:hypothetical protein
LGATQTPSLFSQRRHVSRRSVNLPNTRMGSST